MSRAFLVLAITSGLLGFCATTGEAQALTPSQYDYFDDPATGFELAGWVVDPPSPTGVAWAVDATPALVATGGPSSAFSGTAGLNVNDGTTYDDDETLTVSSPWFDVTGTPTVVFGWSITMNSEPDFDILTIEVEDSVLGVLSSITFGSAGSTSTTIAMGSTAWETWAWTWGTAGYTNMRMNFRFTSDFIVSGTPYTGCFLDNFYCACTDSIPPIAPDLTNPTAGETVTLPITFTWENASDTDDCGPGRIATYNLEIDDDPLFGSIDVDVWTGQEFYVLSALGSGTWNWRVTAYDSGFATAISVVETFYIEPELAPDAPTALYVNEIPPGAQAGDAGTVDPLLTLDPAFSAIYTDPNTVANAVEYHLQIALNGDFVAGIVYDSLVRVLSPPVLDGERTPDLTIIGPSPLQKDQTYAWRIAFGDGSLTLPTIVTGVEGPWSIPQTFRIGDDFEFGVRPGSSNHSRKCWVATAAYGNSEAPAVRGLQGWRTNVMETSGGGRLVSRAYHTGGALIAPAFADSASVRTLLGFAGAATCPGASWPVLALLTLMIGFGARRFIRN